MTSPAEHAQLLDAAHYRLMPWKNGLGTTHEIAVHPPQASLAAGDFLWRVSLADVTSDCDFSLLPGYDRTIALVSGKGMELDFDQTSAKARLMIPGASRRFSGDWLTHCRLLDGPVRDFNVMTARGQVEHHCDRVSGDALETEWDPVAETLLCYCIRGTLVVKMSGSGEWQVSADQSLYLPTHATRPNRVRLMLASHTRETLSLLVRLRSLWSDRDLDEAIA